MAGHGARRTDYAAFLGLTGRSIRIRLMLLHLPDGLLLCSRPGLHAVLDTEHGLGDAQAG